MKKIKEYKGIIIIVLVLILGSFYWFQIRPTQIRKECIKTYPNAFRVPTDDNGVGRLQSFGNWEGSQDKAGYQKCLLENGLDN